MQRFFAIVTVVVAASVGTLAQNTQPQLASRDQQYRLQPSDVLDVDYVYTPEYNQTAAVDPEGFIRLKLIGGLKVEGMTLDEATAAITAKASVPLNAPEISVLLKDYVKPHFTVCGEVVKPGIYDMHGNVTLLQAIAMSGGFKETSKQTQVLLVRKTNTDLSEVRMINVKELSSSRGVREDFTLRADDMLVVPKNRLGKVEPYVRVTGDAFESLYGVALVK